MKTYPAREVELILKALKRIRDEESRAMAQASKGENIGSMINF